MVPILRCCKAPPEFWSNCSGQHIACILSLRQLLLATPLQNSSVIQVDRRPYMSAALANTENAWTGFLLTDFYFRSHNKETKYFATDPVYGSMNEIP